MNNSSSQANVDVLIPTFKVCSVSIYSVSLTMSTETYFVCLLICIPLKQQVSARWAWSRSRFIPVQREIFLPCCSEVRLWVSVTSLETICTTETNSSISDQIDEAFRTIRRKHTSMWVGNLRRDVRTGRESSSLLDRLVGLFFKS